MYRYSRKIVLLIFSILLMGGGTDLIAQSKKKKQKGKDGRDQYVYSAKKERIIPRDNKYQKSGWLIGPGITYTWPGKWNQQFDSTHANGTQSEFQMKTRGRPGFYLEAGRYKIFKKGKIFRYFDYGIALKSFGGAEFVTDSLKDSSGNPLAATEYEGKFNEVNVDGFVNINNVIRLGGKMMLQNSLGLNVDYRFIGSANYQNSTNGEDDILNLNQFVPQADPLRFNLHYKIGIGFRTNPYTVVIPSLEVPIMTIIPAGDLKPTFQYFNSRYLPLIFSVRIMFLRKYDKNSCPPVYSRDQGIEE